MRDDDAALALRVVRRHGDELEVQGVVIVQDEQAVLAVHDRVLERVLHALPPRPYRTRLRGDVTGQVDEVLLARDAGAHADHEVATAARDPGAEPELLVGLVEELDVVRHRGPEPVQPQGVRTPGLVAGRVEDAGAVGGEERAAGVRDLVGERDPRLQVADAHGVELVALEVRRPQQLRRVVGGVERAEREELVPLRLGVAVQQHHLSGDGHPRLETRRRPVALDGGGPAVDAVLRAFLGAAVVPPVSASRRHGEIRLLHAALDLLEQRLAERRQMRRLRLGVRVLGLQVRDDLGGVLGTQPLVRVVDRVAVVRAEGGTAGGDRGVSHRPTLSQVELTGTGDGGRIYRGR